MTIAEPTVANDDLAMNDTIVPLIIRGKVIEDDLVAYPMRQGGGQILAPDLLKRTNDLVTTPATLDDIYAISMDEIIDFLARVGVALDLDTNEHLRVAYEASLKASALPPSILEGSYRGLPMIFQKETIENFVETQVGRAVLDGWVDQDIGNGKTMSVRAFGARSVHIIAGNSPSVAFLTILRSAITRSDAIIKLPSNDPMTAIGVIRTMIDINADHPVTRHVSAAYWKGGDEQIESRIYQPRNIEKIVAWGGFASVTHVTKYLQPGIDLITLDPKHSGSIVGPEALASDESIAEVAGKLAMDIGAYNQELCASARVIYVQCDQDDPAQMEKLNQLGKEVMARLPQLPDVISTKAMSLDRTLQAEINGISMLDDFYRIYQTGDPADGAVIVSQMGEPVEFADVLANRVANLVPIATIDTVLERVNAATQTVGVYPDSLKAQIRDALGRRGAQHIVPLGGMLAMGTTGPQDGLEVERRMLRWVRDMNG